MNVLLCPVGSAGDVYPMVGLGRALRERGHRVVLITSAYFQDLAERAGLECVPLGTPDQFLRLADHPDLWHPLRGFRYVFNTAVTPWMREVYRQIEQLHEPGNTAVLGSCLAFGARIAREKLGVPLLTVHLQPAVIWSDHESPKLPGMLSGPGVPAWLKRFQFGLGERWFIDPVSCAATNGFLSELDLPPMRRTVRWWNSPDGVLCLFPSWYAPAQADWPDNTSLSQFPLWDESGLAGIPHEMERFLSAGAPPIVFTPGSAMLFGERFFQAAVAACQRLGQRGLLLSRFERHVPQDLPDGVRHFEFAPFSELLPRAAAVVHHGGIGSTSQGLAAGIPQLVMPMSHDQPDNAERLIRLGVGAALPPRKFSAARVANALRQLMESPRVHKACQTVASRFANVDPFADACRIVERFAAHSATGR